MKMGGILLPLAKFLPECKAAYIPTTDSERSALLSKRFLGYDLHFPKFTLTLLVHYTHLPR